MVSEQNPLASCIIVEYHLGMREVRCIVSAENEKKLTALLADLNIKYSDSSEVLIIEQDLQNVQSVTAALIITFNPARLDLLRDLLSAGKEEPPEQHGPGQPGFIIGSRHNTRQILQTDDILFFRADGNYVYAVTSSAEFEVKHRLYELEQRFRCGRFVRTGKSFIVNIMKVTEIIPWFGSRLLLRIDGTGQRLEVSRTYVKSFREFLEL